jgi:uncharacterized membrane protein
MRRFSVRSVMILIVGAAIGVTALRNANSYWAVAIATSVVAALATSGVGALTLRGGEQSGCAGFAVFSGVYLIAAVVSEYSGPFKSCLGTAVALNYVQFQVGDYTLYNANLAKLRAESRALCRSLCW